MDESDFEAAELEQQKTIATAIANARITYTKLKPAGYCYNCGADVNTDQLYCDAECASEFEYIKQRQKQNVTIY